MDIAGHSSYSKQLNKKILAEVLAYQRDYAADWLHYFHNDGKRVYLFGAGEAGRAYAYILKNMGADIFAYCDNNPDKVGTAIGGTPVVSFEEMLSDDNKYVVISSSNAFGELLAQCENSGVKRGELCPIDWLWYEPRDKEYILERVNDLLFAYERCEDELSRSVYINCLLNRISRDRRRYKDVKSENGIYFDRDIIALGQSGEIFADCGAAYGDTALEFFKLCGGKVYAFEPETEEYQKLIINTKGMDNLIPINAGVGKAKGTGAFNKDSFGMGGRFEEGGDEAVSILALDEALPEYPTFIKMDIQGYEMPALRGAAETIKNAKPKMALCVYHKVTDFFDIPRHVLALRPDYKMYFRHYGNDIGDTVCYFI